MRALLLEAADRADRRVHIASCRMLIACDSDYGCSAANRTAISSGGGQLTAETPSASSCPTVRKSNIGKGLVIPFVNESR